MKRMNLENKIEQSRIGGSKLDQQIIDYNLVVKRLNDTYYLFPQTEKGEDVFIENQVCRIDLVFRAKKQLINSLGENEGSIKVYGHKNQLSFFTTFGAEKSYKMDDCGYENLYWRVNIYKEHYKLLLRTFEWELKDKLWKRIAEEEKQKKKLLCHRGKTFPAAYAKNIETGKKELIQEAVNESFPEDDIDCVNCEGSKDKIKALNWAIKNAKKDLLALYQHELNSEKDYWKNNQIYITNPYHVEDLKNRVKQLKGEIN
jgi:hypothetical protein